MKNKNTQESLKSILLGLIVFIGLSSLYAWTGPTQTAPNGNVSAPVNIGTDPQVKSGGLGVTNLLADTVKILTGAGAGKVLTSDADGDASWETPATSNCRIEACYYSRSFVMSPVRSYPQACTDLGRVFTGTYMTGQYGDTSAGICSKTVCDGGNDTFIDLCPGAY